MIGLEGWKQAALAEWVDMAPVDWVYTTFWFDGIAFDHAMATGEGWERVGPQMLGYALLRGGWRHLLMNGVALLSFGNLVTRYMGIGVTMTVLIVSAFCGALAFGLIAQTGLPMLGASGAVFGLLGVYIAWQERALRLSGRSRMPILRQVLGLAAINLLLYFGLGGLLAWEAHLGGFIAGALLAQVYYPR